MVVVMVLVLVLFAVLLVPPPALPVLAVLFVPLALPDPVLPAPTIATHNSLKLSVRDHYYSFHDDDDGRGVSVFLEYLPSLVYASLVYSFRQP